MKSFLISLFLHVILILLICFAIKSSKTQTIGITQTPEAYVVTEPALITDKNQHTTLPHKTNQKALPKAIHARQAANHSSTALSTIMQQPKAGQNFAILILLHNKIQQQLSLYQDEIPHALQQNIELTLTAYPDGSVQNIKIISSSNSDEVSAAILSVLQNMPLIAELKNVLTQAEDFQLTVEVK